MNVNSSYYKNNVCIIPAEGRTLIAKQANGIKFAAVGAVLFSDVKNSIKSAYMSGGEKQTILNNITLEQLQNYTTLVFKQVPYKMEGGLITPTNFDWYKNALESSSNLFPVQLAYGTETKQIEGQDVTKKFLSYDFVLDPASVNIERIGDLNFDGFAILGLPYKPIASEVFSYIAKPQKFSILAFVYFPQDDQKFQILYTQPKNVAMNYEIHFYVEPHELKGLSYITNKGLEPKNPQRFLFGLHKTNDGKHNRG